MLIRKKKKVTTTTKEVVGFTCDRCKQTFTEEEHPFEVQEAHFIRFVGGYGSVFGDGSPVACELCQHCLLDLIGVFVHPAEE